MTPIVHDFQFLRPLWLLGLRDGQLRDPDHRFEWDRSRFRNWANGVARRNGYQYRVGGIGEAHPELGSPSQYARFEISAEAQGSLEERFQ